MSHTCVSCALEFQDVPAQRSHMKSDWHRYNLKRRVAQLPPISEATFDEKIALMTQNEEQPAEAKLARKQVTKKDVRRQQKEALQAQRRELLAAREALQAQFGKLSVKDDAENPDLESSLNKAALGSNGSPENVQVSPPSEDAPSLEEKIVAEKLANRVHIPVTTCLFCPARKQMTFDTLQDNLDHMWKAHGLYVPEKKYLVDPEGLISYMGEKLGLGNVCLVCSYQGKSLEAVREHMMSKRHMKIPYETEPEKLEISDFYDFTSSYDNYLHVQESADIDGDNDEWEDVSDDAKEDVNESDDDNVIPEDPIIDMGTELILPSGVVVGHRSMAKYYRQNLPPDKILTEGQGTVIAAETRHFVAPAQRKELAMAKRAWGLQKKREDTNDRRAQKFINNQPHFRDPLLQ